MYKDPQDSDLYRWTTHAKMKMRQWNLSAARVKRVIRAPLRMETGVAEKTIAVMQPQSVRRGPDGKKTWNAEIWVMYKLGKRRKPSTEVKSGISSVDPVKAAKIRKVRSALQNRDKQIVVISAWRYPAQTKEGEPLPPEIWDEINEVS